MNRKYLLTVLTICLSCMTESVMAWQYGSEKLKLAGTKLNITKMLPDSIANTDTVLTINSIPVAARIKEGTLEHLGWKLFINEQRKAMPSAVYDYLEFACLDDRIKITENPFVYKNLKFKSGSWDMLRQKALQCSCSVEMLENVAYRVVWNFQDSSTAEVTFPIGYSSLYMMTRTEIEQRFITQLKSFKAESGVEVNAPEDKSLTKTADGLWELPGDYYIIPEVNRNIYFMDTKEHGKILVWNKRYPAESVANMLVSGDKWLMAYPIEMTFTTHDRKVDTLKVSICQLLGYAKEKGCIAYWGCDTVSDTNLTGSLFLYNPAYGYDHVITLTCNPSLIGDNSFSVKARAALFSPTTNIKNLFGQNKGKSTPKIIE